MQITFNNYIPKTSYNRLVSRQTPVRKSEYDTVSFSSKNILTKEGKEITKLVSAAVNDSKNLIGKGSEGSVYKIPDTDYCVKILHGKTSDFKNWRFNMYPNDEVNHIVAKSEDGAVIMKHIKGTTLKYGQIPDEVYDLPDESYINLLKQINDAHKKYMVFDSVPRNIIYNSEDKSLTAIDFLKEDNFKYYAYTPLNDVFNALKNEGNTEKGAKTNLKLGEKLLNIALDNVSGKKPQQISVISKDIDALYNNIKWQNNKKYPSDVDSLKTQLNKYL